MPDFTRSASFKVIRDIKAYLYLKTGLTRGPVPEARFARSQNGGASQAQEAQPRAVSGHASRMLAEGPPVFFIVGSGKSGTTWLMSLLNAHPEVLSLGEGRIFNREWERDDLRHMEARVPPRSLYGLLANSDDLRLWAQRSVWGRNGEVEEHLDNLTRLAIDYFLRQKLASARPGKRIVGDKTPFLPGANVVEEISRIYPQAKVIHIIRDGRDVEVSWVHHRLNRSKGQGGIQTERPEDEKLREAYRDDPRKAVEMEWFDEQELRRRAGLWNSLVGDARRDGPALLGDNYAEVRYEDMLQSPHEEAGRLIQFLGAASDEAIVRDCVEKTSFENSTGRKKGEEDPTAFLRKGVAGDWKTVFTEKDRRIFEEEAGELLVSLGYEQSHDR